MYFGPRVERIMGRTLDTMAKAPAVLIMGSEAVVSSSLKPYVELQPTK